jgi:hypothetical protein
MALDGFTGAVDYILVDASGIYARFLYSHFNNFGERWVYSPAINSFITPTEGGPDGQMSFQCTDSAGASGGSGRDSFRLPVCDFRMFLP